MRFGQVLSTLVGPSLEPTMRFNPLTTLFLALGLLACGGGGGGGSTAPSTPVPDFSFTLAPATATAGLAASSAAAITRTNGHAAALSFTVASNAQNITGSGSAAASATSGSLSLAVPAATAAGTYALTVNGTDGSLARTATVSVTVNAAPVPDFSLSAAAVSVVAGQSGNSTVSATRANGHTAAITLSVSANPQAITGAGTLAAAAGSGALSLTVPAATAAGTYPLTVSGTDGTLVRTAALNLTVTAALSRIRTFTLNWGDASLKVGDDVLNASGPITPRTLEGSNLPVSGSLVDTLAVDRTRNMAYVTTTSSILVWHNIHTASGNPAPDRIITMAGVSTFSGIAVDAATDRLYVGGIQGGAGKLFALANASTLNGAVAPAAAPPATFSWMALDAVNKRLYLANATGPNVMVFDNVSALANGSIPSRTLVFTGLDIRKMAIDPAHDRLYLSSRSGSPGGFNILGFANASALNGTVANPDAASAFRYTLGSGMGVMLDDGDRLYVWMDSANHIRVFFNASALAGTITASPDRTLTGVINKSYGVDWQKY